MNRMLLHNDANANTLGFARILVFSIVFLYVFFDRTLSLSYLEPALFYPQGIFRLIPPDYWIGINNPGFLLGFKVILLFFLIRAILGTDKISLYGSCIGFAIFLGIEKGFGGHVDHRELVFVYIMFSIALTPCLDALSRYKGNIDKNRDQKVYQASMLMILSIPILEYVYIAIARLAIGFPEVFHPDVMKRWIIVNGIMRPGRFPELGLAQYYLSQSWLNWTLYFSLAFSTVLEILALALPFLRVWPKRIMLMLLIGFHISIYLLMNIVFVENVAILLLFFNYTSVLGYFLSKIRNIKLINF
ncbi:hypothetical protein [Leptospira andrefontaineae]|uniref:HTTM domain-containing protein n=1 Tax=Leptospira andrefontaineae TaxID=2484976 RepID=A0A4R9HCL3_9LEPT|nr:hypothetical protein [Leptospira andrefontaineae]TGK44557.1 hypothetical protein EHO65_00525 [Leptospira andrefontaineae]